MFSQDPFVGTVVEVQQAEGSELRRVLGAQTCCCTLPQAFQVLPGSLLACTGADKEISL